MKDPAPSIPWKKDVAAHDFDAAEAFLSIRLSPEEARRLVQRLKDAPLTERRANDILRACERRRPELVVPKKARLLFALAQLWPSLGDWIVRRKSE